MSQRKLRPSRKRDPYTEAYEELQIQLELVKDLNIQVSSVFEESTLNKWRIVTKSLDRKPALQLTKLVKATIEVIHQEGPTGPRSRRVLVNMPPKQVPPLVQKGVEICSTLYHLTEFVRDMSLVYLVSQFESFLQKFFTYSLWRWPNALSPEKSITADELRKCAGIDDARAALIEKEVASVMQGDIDAIDKSFGQKWGVKMSKSARWKDCRERFYRRNIIVHNSGYTNRLYREKTGYAGKDARMCVSREYLLESIKLFDGMATMVAGHFEKG